MKLSPRIDSRYHQGAILALALICIALVVHEIFGGHGYLAVRRQRRDFEELQQQIQQLQKENQQLESQIKSLKTDPQAIERMARERMGMARHGEMIFTLPDKHSEESPPSTTPKESPPK